jgi:hypothetical protein
MKEGRDLGVTLIASTMLLLGASYMTQCSPSQRPAPATEAAVGNEKASGAAAERKEADGEPKSARELDEDEGQGDRAKIQRVGRALQTIGANPEMRKTYGLPQ